MIVVDTNIIVYLYITGDHSIQAEHALLKDRLWVAPLLWRSEFRNVLTLYVQKEFLSLEEAEQLMDKALHLMQGHEYEMASHPVLALATSSTCSAYDCEFVALAKDLEVPLVTADKLVLKQFPETAVALEEFVAA